MARNHKRKLGSRKYTTSKEVDPTVWERALAEIKNGASQRAVAIKYGVSRGTLQNRLNNKHEGPCGHPTVFTSAEEKIMVDYVLSMAEWGVPVCAFDLRVIARNILDKAGRTIPQFKGNFPGPDWAQRFIRDHPDLSFKNSQNIKPCRAEVDRECIAAYFSNLKELVVGVPGQNIVNYDETNLTDDPGRQKCLFKRGCKYPDRIMSHSKTSTSIMCAASAAGDVLPMYVVYKAEHLWSTWTNGGPPGTRYNRSKSGWFDSSSFEDWFDTCALPYLKRKTGSKVLIGDNLSSHISPHVLEECKKHNIKFVCFPPNATHICQPLDVAFFRPMKERWRQLLRQWKATHSQSNGKVTKDVFPALLKQLMEKLQPNSSKNIQSGFRKCGIFPLNPEQVLKGLPSADSNASGNVAEAFIDHVSSLRRARESNGDVPKRKRRRLTVEPGKSMSEMGCNASNDTAPNDTAPLSGNDAAKEAAPENQADHQRAKQARGSKARASRPRYNENDLEEGRYAVVKYVVGKRTKFYVGKITEVNDREIDFLFMRGTRNKGIWSFIFPTISIDCDTLVRKDLVALLPAPELRSRGRFKFDWDFEQYGAMQ